MSLPTKRQLFDAVVFSLLDLADLKHGTPANEAYDAIEPALIPLDQVVCTGEVDISLHDVNRLRDAAHDLHMRLGVPWGLHKFLPRGITPPAPF